MAIAGDLEKDVSDSELDRWRFHHSYQNLLQLRVGVGSILELAAYRRVCATAIACERYRLAHGAWPEKLEDLIPTFLSETPTDPFDNQPLRYVVDGDAMTLYSVGMDREDDGGVVNGSAAEGDSGIRLPSVPDVDPSDGSTID